MPENYLAIYNSPIGVIEIGGSENGISRLVFVDHRAYSSEIPAGLRKCVEQLDEYFSGHRKEFSLTLDMQGTEFQKRVWRELEKIPYGQTASYREIAQAIGSGQAVRAVGAANGQNPVSIIVPCHRVIGSNGGLTGYGGGLWRKEWLLNHESGLPQARLFPASPEMAQ